MMVQRLYLSIQDSMNAYVADRYIFISILVDETTVVVCEQGD